ncbi:HMG-Y-related protein A isoform X2 [Prosopis cineraria]|uniref:HMG-Y-related protein A isoform X2 n=1 Tax=Prosopis cineraria TaxID=364024 RepID=UPI00240F5850|nr:HMG-Y-related protein A isoform X2 [Prosopis cineraria]
MATEPPSLPPYPEMIMKALEALNEPNGANKSAIAKHIEATYGELPASHSTLLSHHLNRMKESGELVFAKNNYMKPDPNAPPKRGRGRPPKPKAPLPPGTVLSPPRPRGRPPKDPSAPPKPKTSTGSGRPRGRPKKVARTSPENVTVTSRPRGRPPKEKPALTEVSVGQ